MHFTVKSADSRPNYRATRAQIGPRVSFFLPITLREGIPGGPRSWRSKPDRCGDIRFQLLLRSFLRFFNQDDLLKFLILCPEDDLIHVKYILRSVTIDTRYRVVPEDVMCPDHCEFPRGRAENGWVTQQILKLAAATSVGSEYYVTLDSDIVCLKPFSMRDLVSQGRARLNVETFDEYKRFYRLPFANWERQRKLQRYQKAASILGYRRPTTLTEDFYGETPCVLHAESVKDLCEFLDTKLGSPWHKTLAEERGWTEYSLYFQFLEMSGTLDRLYIKVGCNAILDLERSVWQPSCRYKCSRAYDHEHFREGLGAPERGPFVAIQSWLPTESWLPPWCTCIEDFYHQLAHWVL